MREFLNCNSCNAIVLTSETNCQHCGNEFRENGTAAKILQLKDEIERKIVSGKLDDLIIKINESIYKDHPIIKYRKAKLKLIELILVEASITTANFLELILLVEQVARVSPDYWIDFVATFLRHFPNPKVILSINEYCSIKSLIVQRDFPGRKLIEDRLFDQAIISECGVQFFNEYHFYINPKNFIDNHSFKQKRDHLILMFDDFKKRLNTNPKYN